MPIFHRIVWKLYNFIMTKAFLKHFPVNSVLSKRRNIRIMNHVTFSYADTVKTLNSLQSITPKLTKHPDESKLRQAINENRCSISCQDLDQLSVIHVAGTKGKGSTCVYCEQLLMKKGYRTGLFTSPHLITVTERFRINGKSISEEMFVTYFWKTYNTLKSQQTYKGDMPSYFAFLTVMAFKMFTNEKVDVAIIETGMGGEYDSTNILKKVPIVGISSLGFDHTAVLGNTLEEIAWQKSGIMKPNSVTIISHDQPPETYNTLKKRSLEKKALLLEAPPIDLYEWHGNPLNLDMINSVQKINVSLAIQLAYAWINRNNIHVWIEKCKPGSKGIQQAPIWKLNQHDKTVINNVKCPGRNQVINVSQNLTYFLDGAHTIESITLCSKWFFEHYPQSHERVKNILIFNITAQRDYRTFLHILLNGNEIDLVILCPIITYFNDSRPDAVDRNYVYEEQLEKCEQIRKTISFCNVKVLKSIKEAIDHVSSLSSSDSNIFFRVLVTGSLKLVGGALDVLKY
ncbi:putative folylpolyglutamate synthase isoform X2 [Adelges cooleyi]|uniref:putative folylpolyglutamate synthase isoform X2 n=1 Tax=Adelges cooleyi TaxID=133065 RepID=UPI0021806C50|nr:putative folylpolyglutamate synthase isoform X2 [Adelges cooleyi]